MGIKWSNKQNEIDEIIIQIGGKEKLVVINTGEDIELFSDFKKNEIKFYFSK